MWSLVYATSTSTKIKTSKKILLQNASIKKRTSGQLTQIAKTIKLTEKELITIEENLDKLSIIQKEAEEEYAVLKVKMSQFERDFVQTNSKLETKRKAFLSLLSEQFAIIFAMEKSHEPTQKSLIAQEVYQAYKIQNNKLLDSLKSDIQSLHKEKKKILARYQGTKQKINTIIKKREVLASQKVAKKKLRKKLSEDEEKYNVQLSKIEDKQHALRSTLAQLNILQANEVQEAKRVALARKEAIRKEQERQRDIRAKHALALSNSRKAQDALKRAKTEEAKKTAQEALTQAKTEQAKTYSENDPVKQINSSYKKSQTYRYAGGKTISPLRGARVIKRFGTYTDPIYKIKIFNESVTLQASSDVKVQNVLNGKVVFSGQSSMLGKVVVVSHSNKIHTVYAGLSKIAPTIHVGAKIQKGYIVGKVNQKLIFQATKNSKHIDPLELIRI